MKTILKNDWNEILKNEFKKEYYLKLREFLKVEYQTQTIYPNMHDIFNALHYTPYHNVKVVILGQDPYHGANQAHGLSFSVQHGIKPPPSLINIYKEIYEDLGFKIPSHGYLKSWADEGVLMLNTVLTVREKTPNSHKNKGWEFFTDKVISCVNEKNTPVVFILWGKNAQEKENLITNPIHKIFKSAHPSPFSANKGFLGSKVFSKTNNFLKEHNLKTINWEIID